MALDAYVWLAQRLHRVPPGKPQFITWAAAYEQCGSGYAALGLFRRVSPQVQVGGETRRFALIWNRCAP